MKLDRPIIALMYDFDLTLCTKAMQEYGFIPDLGMDAGAFWSEVDEFAREKQMDRILAYMYVMVKLAKERRLAIDRDTFVAQGREIEFFPGVREWFPRINAYAADEGVQLEHYIISSGLREIIEGSAIYREFTEVYACEFLYDADGLPIWPKTAVNYTTKTQFLFRINKNIPDVPDDAALNRYLPEDDRRVPFRNMIYIGDGLTDVPCMKLVKTSGGCSIGIFADGRTCGAAELLRDGRVDYIVPGDYTEAGELDGIVRSVIRKMRDADHLVQLHKRQADKFIP